MKKKMPGMWLFFTFYLQSGKKKKKKQYSSVYSFIVKLWVVALFDGKFA